MFNKVVIDYKDQKLIVKRRIRESHLNPEVDKSELKDYFGSDIILRKDGYLYFCETIQEAEILEIIPKKD